MLQRSSRLNGLEAKRSNHACHVASRMHAMQPQLRHTDMMPTPQRTPQSGDHQQMRLVLAAAAGLAPCLPVHMPMPHVLSAAGSFPDKQALCSRHAPTKHTGVPDAYHAMTAIRCRQTGADLLEQPPACATPELVLHGMHPPGMYTCTSTYSVARFCSSVTL
jgi:hypothetical protein